MENRNSIEKSRRSISKALTLFVGTVWVVIYSNSRMSDLYLSYSVLHIFDLPRAVRGLEVVLLVLLLFRPPEIVLSPLTKRVQFWCALFVFVGLIGLWLGPGITGSGLQDIYLRVVPFVYFLVASKFQWTRNDITFVAKVYLWVMVCNLIIVLFYQMPLFGSNEDDLHGFLSDAHILGALLIVGALSYFTDYFQSGQTRHLFLGAVYFFFSLYPRNGKAILLCIISVGCIVAYQALQRLRWSGRIAAVVLALAVSFIVTERIINYFEKDNSLRVSELLSFGIENAGPIVAWPLAWEWLSGRDTNPWIGLGAAEYGWVGAGRNLASGSPSKASEIFELEFTDENPSNAGFLFRTNTWSSLLVEFGILGAASFVFTFVYVVLPVIKCSPQNPVFRRSRYAGLAILGLVMFQGFFTPFSNWSESILMFPSMLIAVFCHQCRVIEENE